MKTLTHEEKEQRLSKIFDAMDTDNNGSLDLDELRKCLGPDRAAIALADMDFNSDNKISRIEFYNCIIFKYTQEDFEAGCRELESRLAMLQSSQCSGMAPPAAAIRHDPSPASISHVLSQGPSLWALLKVALGAPFKSAATEESIANIQVPGPLVVSQLPCVPVNLLADYAKWAGSDPSASVVPAHLFPQWTFAPMAAALAPLPFAMTLVINQGFKLEMHGPVPVGEPMEVTAQLWEVVRLPGKIKITTKITTATKSAGPAYTAYVYAIVPQKSPKKDVEEPPKPKREPAQLPVTAECISAHAIDGSSGRHYAYLSGDFNPIHWISAYAKMSGFKEVILHGFAQSALMHESLVRSRCGGDPAGLTMLDVRFVAPLVMPGEMSVHVDDASSSVFVTNASGAITMIGNFEMNANNISLKSKL